MSNGLLKNKLDVLRNKKSFCALALLLIMVLSVVVIALPVASAHEPAWTIPTYAYIVASPNPAGVNQQVFLTFWIDKVPPSAAGIGGDRWQNYTVEVTKPDGTNQNLGTFTSGPESTAYTIFTPTQTGTYTFLFKFPGQTALSYNPANGVAGRASPLVNDTFLGSSATTTLTVQQAQVTPVEDYPLPTSYWTRPIEGQNTNWGLIASNYLGNPQIFNLVQPDGSAPSTAHVMWTKEFGFGGVVGGSYAVASGQTYYDYTAYETQFGTALIVQGRLYYALPKGTGGSYGPNNGYVCVDLQTGEQIYWQDMSIPTFGQLYDYESMNQHGVVPNGYLWRTSGTTWMAYDPIDGQWLFNLTNIPSGAGAVPGFGIATSSLYGPNGEILFYNLNAVNGWLGLWNNTAAPGETAISSAGASDANIASTSTSAFQWRPIGKVIDASTAYSWNVTIPTLPPTASILGVIPDDVVLVSNGFSSGMNAVIGNSLGVIGTPENSQVWAISLKPATRGQLLWTKTYAAPEGNLTRVLGPIDPVNRVFTMADKETMQWSGFSIDNGNLLWGPVGSASGFQFFGSPMAPIQTGYTYLGKLYTTGYGGVLYCFDTTNGNLLWTYGNGGVGNSTNSGLDTPWGNYPIFPCGFADGKVYLYTTEHSANAPPYKGSRVRCVDATTGAEVWTLMSWSSSAFAIADGYAAYLNLYDNQVTVVGKGPSATTVEVQNDVIAKGNSILIKGTVTDVCAGAKKLVDSGEFNVVPAIADASMGKWMEYLYMQKPMPSNAQGVQVHLTAVDPNGNYQDMGYATTDLSGMFSAMWTPPVEGKYTIFATFEGSEGYYPSSAETVIGVTEAPAASPTVAPTSAPTTAPTTAPTVAPTASPSVVPEPEAAPSTDVYVIAAAAAVIVVVAAVAAVILRKRK